MIFKPELSSNLHEAAAQPLLAEFMSKLAVLEVKVRQGEPSLAREHTASDFDYPFFRNSQDQDKKPRT